MYVLFFAVILCQWHLFIVNFLHIVERFCKTCLVYVQAYWVFYRVICSWESILIVTSSVCVVQKFSLNYDAMLKNTWHHNNYLLTRSDNSVVYKYRINIGVNHILNFVYVYGDYFCIGGIFLYTWLIPMPLHHYTITHRRYLYLYFPVCVEYSQLIWYVLSYVAIHITSLLFICCIFILKIEI